MGIFSREMAKTLTMESLDEWLILTSDKEPKTPRSYFCQLHNSTTIYLLQPCRESSKLPLPFAPPQFVDIRVRGTIPREMQTSGRQPDSLATSVICCRSPDVGRADTRKASSMYHDFEKERSSSTAWRSWRRRHPKTSADQTCLAVTRLPCLFPSETSHRPIMEPVRGQMFVNPRGSLLFGPHVLL